MCEINENGEILVDKLAVFIPNEEINLSDFNKDISTFKHRRKTIYVIACIPFAIFFISSFLEIETLTNICGVLFGILVFLAIILTWGNYIIFEQEI